MSVDHRGPQAENAELRRLLVAVGEDGWESPSGRQLLTMLGERARAWVAGMERHAGLEYGSLTPSDLVTDAWLVLARFPDHVAAAEAPWGYLWDAVRRRTSVRAAGMAVCSDRLAQQDMKLCRTITTPVRIGAEPWRLEQHIALPNEGHADARWSPALRQFLELLVDCGAGRDLWADAIDRAVDVLADARRSYEERDLRHDPYLRNRLGLQPKQLTALGALLIGTRRGERERQSLLMALHRDLSTSPADVPGAPGRIAHLLDPQPVTSHCPQGEHPPAGHRSLESHPKPGCQNETPSPSRSFLRTA